MFIILRGMLIGNAVSFLLIFLQNKYHIVHLDPETYYMDTVPVQSEPWIWIVLNLVTLLFTLAALIVPSYLVSRIQPAKAIRFE